MSGFQNLRQSLFLGLKPGQYRLGGVQPGDRLGGAVGGGGAVAVGFCGGGAGAFQSALCPIKRGAGGFQRGVVFGLGNESGSLLGDFIGAGGKTPAALRRSTDEFGNWLKRQQKRLDGKLVDRIYAKGGEGRAVLYLVTVPGFSSIESSIRHQIVEVAWRFWRERCEENGNISAAEKAHLVVLNAKLKVIGGSGRADGSKLWVAE